MVAMRRGLSNAVILLIIAIFLVMISLVFYNSANKKSEARDDLRREHLDLIARGEETYFDRYGKYTDSVADLGRNMKFTLPSDPVTRKPYVIFVNEAASEWCAVAQSEVINNQYFTRTAARLQVVNGAPVNVQTCKQNI